MYISLNWLKDFVKLPAKIKPEEVAFELTGHTVEVEGFTSQADRFARVVVGRVLEVAKHPNADRLRLVKVDVKKEKLDIVCGAPNVAVGQLVAVAQVGAILPNGLEIKAAEIRGEKSSGMICAEDELGLGENHEGIMVLKDSAKVGEAFAKYWGADDVVLEIDNKSLSNRPDLLSHYGIAREISAIFDLPLKAYSETIKAEKSIKAVKKEKAGQSKPAAAKDGGLAVKVEDKDLCPRYMAVRVDNITVEESPAWLKERLVAVGQRPINNIVDLTNYVMLDCGQPLHAFDAEKVKKIGVRRATTDEIIRTLDGKERILNDQDLVITDGEYPVALAGVMGGENSEITTDTKSLVFEAANFTAAAVRKTSQRLGLRTEASVRFEKCLDPHLPEAALGKVLSLLKKACPAAEIAGEIIDINSVEEKILEIGLDPIWLTEKLGVEVPRASIINTLERLGFIIDNQEESILKVTVPSWRATKDIKAREDLAEEVLRLYGYDKVPARLPEMALNVPEVNQERVEERKIKDFLVLKHSLNEAYNYSFTGANELTKLNIDFFNYLRLANPLTESQAMLRQSLVPGLIGNLRSNQAKSDGFGFFEIGSVFFNAPGNLPKDQESGETLPYQEKRLGLALVAASGDLFSRLKGMITSLLQAFIGQDIEVRFSPWENPLGWADKRLAAKVSVLGEEIGVVAIIDPVAAANINLKKPAVLAELNFRRLVEIILNLPPKNFHEPAKYPPVVRDLAFVVEDKIMYNDIKDELVGFNPLIGSVELFDVYSGDKLPAGQKSLAFHILYQSEERTLTAAEVDKIQADLIARLAQKFEARLRDF